MKVETYKVIIEPQSSFVTPLHSDTIFGHLAWAVAYSGREDVLKKFLEDFKNNPPFILSSGFPEGKLPIPILRPLTKEEKKIIAKDVSKSLIEIEDELKEIKELTYIPVDALNGLIEDLSNVVLTRYLLKNKNVLFKEEYNQMKEEMVMRTAVNRTTGSALEAQLYNCSEDFYAPGVKLNIWIRFFSHDYIDKVEKWFHYLESYGYGADLSTGAGQFKIAAFSEEDGSLPEASTPNAFITISNFSPKATDPVDGYYNYIVKRGKLGGLWSVVGLDGSSKPNVWKNPVVMFTPGSVFKFDDEMKRFYGRMVENIYQPNANIIQYALAFPLGVKLRE